MTTAKDIAEGFHLLKVGGVWCAVGPEFVDFQQSPAGFGTSRGRAIKELRAALRRRRYPDYRLPHIGDFTVHK
jgi:hypothetical protein